MIAFRKKKAPSRTKPIIFSGLVSGLAAYFLDPDRGRSRRTKARDMTLGRLRTARRKTERAGRAAQAEIYGVKEKVKHLKEEPKDFNDATLKAKVESELFKDQSTPKGDININVEKGVVVIRGRVDSPDIARDLESRARNIQGVVDVENLVNADEGVSPNSSS